MPLVHSVVILANNQRNKNLPVSCKTVTSALLFLTAIASAVYFSPHLSAEFAHQQAALTPPLAEHQEFLSAS